MEGDRCFDEVCCRLRRTICSFSLPASPAGPWTCTLLDGLVIKMRSRTDGGDFRRVIEYKLAIDARTMPTDAEE